MADTDEDKVCAAYAAFAAGNIDTAVADLDDDVVWTEPDSFPNGGRRRGRAAVADYLRASRAMWRELSSTPTVYRRADRIVALHEVRGTLLDGTAHTNVVADVFTFRAGRVVDMTAYADPAELPAALRLP